MSQQLPKTSFEGGRILRHLASDPQSAPPPPTPFSPSLTYELYYGLKEKPFSLSADPRFLYRTPTHGPAYDDLLNGIRRREGLIVLTGEIGTGKTTLIRSVLEHLDRRTFSAFVPDPFVSREDLLKMLLVDFGVVSIADLKRGSLNGASRPDLSYPLYEFLDSLVPLQAFAVMIVDEAQNIPLPLLEEIRILSDLEGREKLLQVVLVGQPELRDHLKLPEMRQVDQRVSVRCELRPLALDDVAGYVRHRLNVAGDGDSRVEFSDAAIEAVHRGSGGTPRLINKICDRALARGYAARVGRIDADFVSAGIRDLGLEPPSHSDSPSVARGLPPSQELRRTSQSAQDDGLPPQQDSAQDDGLPPQQDLQQIGQHAGHAGAEEAPATVATIVAAAPSRPLRVIEPDVTPQVLSEFAAESELPRAVRVESTPPSSSWTPAATSTIAGALALGITLVYLYLRSQAGEVSLVALPSPPPRAPIPTLTVPSLPNAWIMPVIAAPKRASAANDPLDRFAIQVASFSTQARADAAIEELAQSGFSARAVTLDYGPSRGQLVQVLLGGYGSADDAQNDFTRVREQFPDARIVGR